MDKLFRILCLMAFVSCTSSEEMEEKGEWYFCNDLQIETDGSTRALTDNTTLRAMLYSLTLETEATDTYVYQPQSNPAYLTLCQVDANGAYQGEAAAGQGFQGYVGERYLAMVSPALPVVDWNGSAKMMAIQTTPNTEVYATTQLEKFDLGEYAAVSFSNPMHEIRSMISFIVRNSSSDLGTLSDVSITLKGAGRGPTEPIYYFPATRQCMVPSGEIDAMTIQDITSQKDASGNTYQQSAPCYILSGIYAPRSVTAEILGISALNEHILDKQYLSVDMAFKQGEVPQTASLLLNANAAELKPRYRYTFEITIASTKIKVVLHIQQNNQWESSGNTGSVIGDDDETIQVGTFPIQNGESGSWEKPGGDLDQTIE